MKRSLLFLGIVLVVLGIAAFAHPTFTYHQQEQVAKIGSFQATVEHEKTSQVPVAAAATLVLTGLALLLLGARRS